MGRMPYQKWSALLRCIAVLVPAVFAVSVRANVISYSASVPLSTTNWNTTVSLTKFDSTLGTLNSVYVELGGHVEGSARFESLDAAPATVTMNLQALISLLRPDNSLLVATLPVVSTSDSVTSFDGTIDFGGTSGRTYSGLTGNDTDSATYTNAGDLALFSTAGFGTITLPTNAAGTSNGSGAGNLILQFATSASAVATVIYDYTPVPEPLSVALLGLAALAIRRPRRRR